MVLFDESVTVLEVVAVKRRPVTVVGPLVVGALVGALVVGALVGALVVGALVGKVNALVWVAVATNSSNLLLLLQQ